MGFLKKLSGTVRGIFSRKSEKSGTIPKSKKRGTSLGDTPVDDWKSQLDPENFRRMGGGGAGDDWQLKTVQLADWYDVISSNVERIRYGEDDKALQVIFKNGSLYQYEDVEPEIFLAFLRAPSPGQFVWYVLRQYGYAYAHLGGGEATTAPAAPRFDEQPYAVPDDIQRIQKRAGRKPAEGGLWNMGTPTGGKAKEPPLPWK